jgi:3-oxoadipate enol-lactonase
MWAGQLNGLSGTRRVIAVDLPGRGRSALVGARGATMDSYADDLAVTIAQVANGAVDLAGLSMGAYILFALWRRHPELVRSLVLADTRAGADSAAGKEGRLANAERVRAGGTLALSETLLPQLLSPASGPAMAQRALAMLRETPPETAVADLLAMRDRPDSVPTLGGITVPTLVVRGTDDGFMTAEEARLLVDGIPGAQFAAVAGGGHLAPMEQPDAFNQAVAAFLASL